MLIRSFVAALVCTIFFSFSAGAQSLELEFLYERHESLKQNSDPRVTDRRASKPIDVSETRHVTITPTMLSVRGGEMDRIFDFERGLLTYVLPAAGFYVSVSQYAWPVFRDREKENRIFLNRDAAQRGFDIPFSLFELEMMFGGDPESDIAREIARTTEAGSHTFSHDGNGTTRFSLSDQEIPSALADIYRMYLVHSHQIHPAVVDDLAARDTVFSSLEYEFRIEEVHLTDISYQLQGSTIGPDLQIDIPNGFEQRYAFDDRLHGVIEKSRSTQERGIADYTSQMQGHLNAAEFVEAYLLFREFNMHHGTTRSTPMEPLVQRLFDTAPRETNKIDTRTLHAAIGTESNDPAELEAAISVLDQAQEEVAANGHVINVFKANFRAMILDDKNYLAEHEEAVDLLLGALEANPFLTGGYWDLGWKYFEMYQMQDAWSSWDEMRRINPNHGFVANLDDLEQRIRQALPHAFP